MPARRLVPCSVRTSDPSEKSKAASPTLRGIDAPGSVHRNRPAIMRWITTNNSSPKSKTIRFPILRSPCRVLPLAES